MMMLNQCKDSFGWHFSQHIGNNIAMSRQGKSLLNCTDQISDLPLSRLSEILANLDFYMSLSMSFNDVSDNPSADTAQVCRRILCWKSNMYWFRLSLDVVWFHSWTFVCHVSSLTSMVGRHIDNALLVDLLSSKTSKSWSELYPMLTMAQTHLTSIITSIVSRAIDLRHSPFSSPTRAFPWESLWNMRKAETMFGQFNCKQFVSQRSVRAWPLCSSVVEIKLLRTSKDHASNISQSHHFF